LQVLKKRFFQGFAFFEPICENLFGGLHLSPRPLPCGEGAGGEVRSPEQIFTDWFEKGKPLKEKFFDHLQLDITHPAIETEFQKHNTWKEKTQIRATPTIFVNGYKLPDNYKIEDLRNFTEFKSEPPSLRAERSSPGK
jgi:hypothetical protein